MGTLPGVPRGVVVVAEDNEDIRELYAQCFAEAGFTVECATTGAEILEIASTMKVDAFVLDLQMPVMDGWEAIQRLRATYGVGPYILAVSAHIDANASRNAAYDAGANDIVGKPIEPTVLITIVRAALRTRSV